MADLTMRCFAAAVRLSGVVRRGPFAGELGRGRRVFGLGDRGATAVEYALMAALIAVVISVAVAAFGQKLIPLFDVPSDVLNP